MIGETGACNNYPPPNQNWQQPYIQSITTELDNGVYPNVHALLYFDAPGSYNFTQGGACDWSLKDQSGSAALTQFYIMANDPNFTGMITQNNP